MQDLPDDIDPAEDSTCYCADCVGARRLALAAVIEGAVHPRYRHRAISWRSVVDDLFADDEPQSARAEKLLAQALPDPHSAVRWMSKTVGVSGQR